MEKISLRKKIKLRLLKTKDRVKHIRHVCLSHISYKKEQARSYCHRHMGKRMKRMTQAVSIIGKYAHTLEMCILAVAGCAILMAHFGFADTNTALPENNSLIYPLTQVAKVECRTMHRDDMPESCKVDLPIIHGANYSTYSSQQDYRDTYTTLRAAAYNDTWNQEAGSHGGVDIATASGTPLYAVADAIVTHAGETSGYGKMVTLKYMLDGVVLHSQYRHMSSVSVSVGQRVTQGQMVGEVGNSGITISGRTDQYAGSHLDIRFLRDNYGRPAYVYAGCPDRTKNFKEIINNGLCRDELMAASYDPVALIEHYKNGDGLANSTTNNTNGNNNTDDTLGDTIGNILGGIFDEIDDTNNDTIPDTIEVVDDNTTNPTIIGRNDIVISGIPLNSTQNAGERYNNILTLPHPSTLDYNTAIFLSENTITFDSNRPLDTLKKGDIVTLRIRIRNTISGENYNGVLPVPLSWESPNQSLSFDRIQAQVIIGGERNVRATVLKNNIVLVGLLGEDIIY